LKHLISLSLLLSIISCSSLKQEKSVEKSVSDMAFSYLQSAQKMHRSELLEESVELYSKASKLFLSKLMYKEFSLSQLKKVLLLIKLKKLKEAQETIDFISFCDQEFDLSISTDIEGVQLRHHLAAKREKEAFEGLTKLLGQTKGLREKRAYYESVLLRLRPTEDLRSKLRTDFASLYSEYQVGGLKNNESFVFVGKSILESSSSFDRGTFLKLTEVATDLEIKSLSRFLLAYQKRFSSVRNKPHFQKLIQLIN
jgi:hypothetical protein